MTNSLHLLAASTLLASAALGASSASAEEGKEGVRGYLALGAASVPEYEGADAQQALPFIAARVQSGGRYLAVEGVSARANVLDIAAWELGPVAAITFGRDDDVESRAVARLAPIDDAVELGAFVARIWRDVGVADGEARVSVHAVQDVSGVHDGWQAGVSAGYAAPAGARWRFGGEVSATFASEDYAATYFSVTPAGAAASGLTAYAADGGLKDAGVAVNATYAATARWSLTAFAGYRRLLGDAADSPIVAREGSPDQFSAGLGLGLSF